MQPSKAVVRGKSSAPNAYIKKHLNPRYSLPLIFAKSLGKIDPNFLNVWKILPDRPELFWRGFIP